MKKDSKRVDQNFTRNCKIPEEFRVKQDVLPTEYEQYLDYYRGKVRRIHTVYCMRKILSGFNIHLQKSNIALCKISIELVDHFLALYNKNYATATCRVNRSLLRGFLKYLYQNGYIKKNLAPLVISPQSLPVQNHQNFYVQKKSKNCLAVLTFLFQKIFAPMQQYTWGTIWGCVPGKSA